MQVITYTNPRELRSHPDWTLILETPHICATESLRYGLNHLYEDSHLKMVSATRLFRQMLPRWFAPMAWVGQYTRMTGLIDTLRGERPEWSDRLRAFRRNQAEVLKGIRTLAEGGLTPSDLHGTNTDERIFQRIWASMEATDPLLQYLRSQLSWGFQEPNTMRDTLLRAFCSSADELEDDSLRLSQVDQLIMHGFFFITPLRMRLIRLMEQAGISLIFLNCWDERYEPVFGAWERFFPNKESWTRREGPLPNPLGQLFGELYQGKPSRVPPQVKTPRILRFPDTTSFLHHLDEEMNRPSTEPPVICSPAHAELNDMLRDFFPERYPQRHFLSYPVGQFLFHLHKMWEEQAETLVFEESAVVACFSSGLLRTMDGSRWVEGRALLKPLRLALPYFAGCRQTSEWIDRAKQLVDALEGVLPAWDTDVPESEPAHRFHAVLANPIRTLSHFQLSAEQGHDIGLLLERLERLAKDLFSHPRVSLHEHLKRLKQLLQDGGADEHLLTEERKLLAEFMGLFLDEHLVAEEVPAKDLAEAMTVFLGSVGKDDDEPGWQRGLIRDFSSVDGMALFDRPLHICLLNEWALPGKRRATPWPLTLRSFRDRSHEAVRMLELGEEAAPSALYLFYYALAFGSDVSLSWVGEWQEERQNESVYLVMLKAAGVPEEDVPYEAWRDVPAPSNLDTVLRSKREWETKYYPAHALAEYRACPRRFYYSYITGTTPFFESDFHMEFLYGRMLGWYMWRFKGAHRPDARAVIDPLFPAWPEVRLRDLAQRWGSFYPQNDQYYGRAYNQALRWLLVPAFTQLQGAREVFDSEAEQEKVRESLGQETKKHPQMKAAPGHGCRFCPHNRYCSEAHLPIDDE